MTDIVERVARAIHQAAEPWDRFEVDETEWRKQARAAIEAITDEDVLELLRWLDFKSCGWCPDEQIYKGAQKLLALRPADPDLEAAGAGGMK